MVKGICEDIAGYELSQSSVVRVRVRLGISVKEVTGAWCPSYNRERLGCWRDGPQCGRSARENRSGSNGKRGVSKSWRGGAWTPCEPNPREAAASRLRCAAAVSSSTNNEADAAGAAAGIAAGAAGAGAAFWNGSGVRMSRFGKVKKKRHEG